MPGRRNEYGWNKTLRFSWGHIIAFVALVFVCYVIFMGVVYWSGGNFLVAGAVAVACLLVLLATSIGVQLCKAVERRFDQRIVLERILLCLYPIVFVAAMLPYNHFWGVVSERKDIESKFSSSLESSKQFFEKYESYADERMMKYEKKLSKLDKNKQENYLLTLRLQLKSENYERLKDEAIRWIDERSQTKDVWYAEFMGNGTSIWNAFLFGNINKIDSAIADWNRILVDYSSHTLSNEGYVSKFGVGENLAGKIQNDLKVIQKEYSDSHGLMLNTIWTAILLFFALLLPYMLQSRNTKAQGFYHLVPVGSRGKSGGKHNKKESDDVSDILPDDYSEEAGDGGDEDGENGCDRVERDDNDKGKGLFDGTF